LPQLSGESDERKVDCVQHQFDAHENHDRVPASQYSRYANRE